MATVTQSVVAPTRKPTTVVIGEYKGKPTLNVCPEGDTYNGLSAGLPKWNRVFGADKDGDNVLFELFKVLYGQADAEGKLVLLESVAGLYESVVAHTS